MVEMLKISAYREEMVAVVVELQWMEDTGIRRALLCSNSRSEVRQ